MRLMPATVEILVSRIIPVYNRITTILVVDTVRIGFLVPRPTLEPLYIRFLGPIPGVGCACLVVGGAALPLRNA